MSRLFPFNWFPQRVGNQRGKVTSGKSGIVSIQLVSLASRELIMAYVRTTEDEQFPIKNPAASGRGIEADLLPNPRFGLQALELRRRAAGNMSPTRFNWFPQRVGKIIATRMWQKVSRFPFNWFPQRVGNQAQADRMRNFAKDQPVSIQLVSLASRENL